MALDTQIPYIKPFQPAAPLEIETQRMTLEDARAKRQATIDAAAEKSALDTALKAHIGPNGLPDLDGALTSLSAYPRAQLQLQGQIAKMRADGAKQHADELDAHDKEAALVAQMFQGVQDQSGYQQAYGMLQRFDPQGAQSIGPDFDPAKVQRIVNAGMSTKEFNDKERLAQEELISGKAERGAASTMALASSQEDWQNRLHQIALYAPKAVVEKYANTPFSPEAVKAAQVSALTPEQQVTREDRLADNERQAAAVAATAANTSADNVRLDAAAKETARHNQVSEAIARARANRPASSGSAGGDASDAKVIAASIISGDQPPTLTGLYRFAAPVRAELARKGYDLTHATEDWTATQKHLATLNGAQQTRLRQAVSFANESLGIIDDLNAQWQGGRFPILNKAQLSAAMNGALGPKAQTIATQLKAQIADLTSELGTVYKGGNSSTDESLRLAAQNLSADWTQKQLSDAVALVRKNLTIRQNSIRNTGAVGGRENNPYEPEKVAPPAQQKSVSLAQIAAVAKKNGTTVEQEKARAAAEGYVIR